MRSPVNLLHIFRTPSFYEHLWRAASDLKREEMYSAFRREEAEKNREYELRIPEMYAKMFSDRNATQSFTKSH